MHKHGILWPCLHCSVTLTLTRICPSAGQLTSTIL
jgi:hypothetical protein